MNSVSSNVFNLIILGISTEKKVVDSKYGDIKKDNEVRSIKMLYDNNNVINYIN